MNSFGGKYDGFICFEELQVLKELLEIFNIPFCSFFAAKPHYGFNLMGCTPFCLFSCASYQLPAHKQDNLKYSNGASFSALYTE